MPFSIVSSGNKFKVINSHTKDVKGTHPSKAKAEAQLRALYANVPEARKKADMENLVQLNPEALAALTQNANAVLEQRRHEPVTQEDLLNNLMMSRIIPEIAMENMQTSNGIASMGNPPTNGFINSELQRRLILDSLIKQFPSVPAELLNDPKILELAAMQQSALLGQQMPSNEETDPLDVIDSIASI